MGKLGKQYKQSSKKSQILLAVILLISLAIVGSVAWWFYTNTRTVEVTIIPDLPIPAPVEEVQEEAVEPEIAPEFDFEKLKAVVDTWAAGVGGQASVVLMDENGDVIAEKNGDNVYFAASLYKLYVAYIGYQLVDDGVFDLQELYLSGNSRADCLDLMIRESDSPCAEKMWVEIGKNELTNKLKKYDINNTDMVNIKTTAADIAKVLALINKSQDLSEVSQQALLESMKNQVYRDALNKGFNSSTTVYNKVGFRDLDEYHDVAIVEFEDGRKMIISVLTNGVGTRNIANLASKIEIAVTN